MKSFNILDKAKEFAQNAHAGQKRANGEDYFNHVLRVSQNPILATSIKAQVAALLHDTIEDCGVEFDTLVKVFGSEIAGIVRLLTRTKEMNYHSFINSIARSGNIHAIRIKFADLEDNMRDSKEGSRLDKYRFAKDVLENAIDRF